MDQLGQVFEQFSELPEEDRDTLIDRGEAWLAANASDLDRTELAERLRRYTVRHKPRLLSDNGPCYIAGELAEYIDAQRMSHVRGDRKSVV